MRFMLKKLNLQLFGEGGGDGAGAASSGTGSDTGVAVENGRGQSDDMQASNSSAKTQDGLTAGRSDGDTEPKTRSQSFDELIKGEFKDEFNKKTQDIINRRFKETKGLEERLRTHDTIMNMLASKYNVDASDIQSLQKALEDDESFYEEEAMEKGLTINQLKEFKKLERANNEFMMKEAERQKEERTRQIQDEWGRQAEELKAKYGLDNFSLEEEISNPEFQKLLSVGISVDSAYKAIHMDEMIGGAMAKTASTVREKMSNSIASRQARPSENGITSTSSQGFKKDVANMTKAERAELIRRSARGEVISLN